MLLRGMLKSGVVHRLANLKLQRFVVNPYYKCVSANYRQHVFELCLFHPFSLLDISLVHPIDHLLYTLLRYCKILAYWVSLPPTLQPFPSTHYLPHLEKQKYIAVKIFGQSGVCDLSHYPNPWFGLCWWEDDVQDSEFSVMFLLLGQIQQWLLLPEYAIFLWGFAQWKKNVPQVLGSSLTHWVLQHILYSPCVAHSIWESDSKLKPKEEFSSNCFLSWPELHLVDVYY